jgi:exodeoxyribonuclease VII small subunit
MATKPNEDFNFEAALAELNQLVEKMERGGISLEESLADFERGIALTRQCQQALKTAEQKVHILLEKNGETVLEPYADNSDEKA